MNEKNVPKIRFPKFTEPWEKRKVSELFKITRGYVLATTETDEKRSNEKPYPVYSSQTKNNGLMGYYSDYLYENAITWTTDGANAGTVNYRPEKFYCTNVCGVLLSDEGYANKMVAEALNLISWKYVSKVGNPKLMNNVMSEIEIYLPNTLEEQEQIGNFFKKLDNLISLHQQKLEHLKKKKKGLLQKMFPKAGAKVPEIRFPEFTGDWEQRKLGEISDKVTEKNINNTYNETFTNSAEYGIIPQRDFFEKDISNIKNLNGYYVVRNDDFVYNPRISNFAPVGPIKRNKLLKTGVMSPLYYVFRTRDIDRTYLEHYFDTTYWHMFMKLNGDSGARSDRFAIKDSVFVEMPIPFPKLEEQKKIGMFFEEFDNLITLHQRKLEHLQKQKKALLQQMFI